MEGYLWGISPDLLYSFQGGHRIALCLICPGPSILPHQTLHQRNNKRDWAGRRWLRRPGEQDSHSLQSRWHHSPLSRCQVGQVGNLGRCGYPGMYHSQEDCSRLVFPEISFYFLRKLTETQTCIRTTGNQAGWQKSWESNQFFPFCQQCYFPGLS